MIISNHQIQNVLAQYLKKDSAFSLKKKEEISKVFKGDIDKITLSQDTQAYLKTKEAIKKLPDTRADKLAKIQQQIKSGTYEVNNEEVAEKMIGRSLIDELI